MTNANLDKVYKAVRDSQEPITSEGIGKKTGLTRSSVQYACTILVAAEKIKRYLGIRGIFVLHEPSPGVTTPSDNDLRKVREEVLTQAREVLSEATTPAWGVYKEATAPARKVYEEAVTQAWRTYQKTVAAIVKEAEG